MTVIKINAITVPADSGDELGRRFAARAGAVDGQPGFEGFELLQPTDGRNTWLVLTRWADEESFQAWTAGQDFSNAHRGGGEGDQAAAGDTGRHGGGTAAAEHQGARGDGGVGHGGAPGPGGGHPQGGGGAQRPVGMSAELWSFRVSTGSSGGRDDG